MIYKTYEDCDEFSEYLVLSVLNKQKSIETRDKHFLRSGVHGFPIVVNSFVEISNE